jgi:hypothetical protein
MLLLYLVVRPGRPIIFALDSGVSINLSGRWRLRTERIAKCIGGWRIGFVAKYE